MRHRIAIALLLLPCAAEPVAADESCSCVETSFRWQGCAADGRCDAGAWHGCTPSADDGYSIGAGCHVTVDGDDVLLAEESPRHLRVRTGGSLAVRGPARLALGAVGLVGEPGSRVELNGCFRRFSAGGDACAPTLDRDALFPAGRVIPCRDLECGDDSELVRLDWSDTNGNLASAVDDLLARIDPHGDAICFWQWHDDRFIGSDSGYCYRVSAVSNDAGERHLDFDVRQTWTTQSDQAGHPLDRRRVLVATLASDAAAGERLLAFEETDLAIGRAGPAGRFLRCPGEPHGHLIAAAGDEPSGDSVLLADARGLARPAPAGTVCHVDWGWAQGDAAFVMAPVHVAPHTPAPDATQVLLAGETTLRGVVLDGLGGNDTSMSGAMLIVRNGPLAAFEHVWAVDPLVTDTAAVLLDDLPCGSRVRHLTVTGGPSDPAHDRNYGLAWFGGAECSYRLEHLYTRYAGDDNFVLESTGADPLGSLEMRYVQAGPSSQPGDSGQFLDLGTSNPTHVSIRDALCTACTSDDGRGSLVAPTRGTGRVENLLWIGVRNGGLVTSAVDADAGDWRFEKFGVIGSLVDDGNSLGRGALAGWVADRFYVRDVRDPRSNPSRLCTGTAPAPVTRSLRRGIFANVALGAAPCELVDADLEDLYFLDVSRTGTAPGPIVSIPNAAQAASLSRVTMGFTRLPVGLSSGIEPRSDAAASVLSLDGPLLTGFRGTDMQAIRLGSADAAAAVAWRNPICFHDNDLDEADSALAAYGVAPVHGVDPEFVDPHRLRFDLMPGSPLRIAGCGAGEAGYVEVDWAHRKTKLVPMYMGPRPSGCGLGAEIALALAAIVRRARPLSRGSRAA